MRTKKSALGVVQLSRTRVCGDSPRDRVRVTVRVRVRVRVRRDPVVEHEGLWRLA